VNFNETSISTDRIYQHIPELERSAGANRFTRKHRLRDAIIGSLDHLKKGSRTRSVAGGHRREDNASHNSLEKTLREIQKTDTVIYTIGLLGMRQERSQARQEVCGTPRLPAAGYSRKMSRRYSICEQVAQRHPQSVHLLLPQQREPGRQLPCRLRRSDSTRGRANSWHARATATSPQRPYCLYDVRLGN